VMVEHRSSRFSGPALDQVDHGVDVAAYGSGIRTRSVRGVHAGPGRLRAPNRRAVGLAAVQLLPTGMDPSIHSDVFARYERGVLEIEH
jgi:hypothetical protein